MDLKQGDMVQIDALRQANDEEFPIWEGEVLGVATTEMPILGRFIIVRVTSGSVPNDTYPFDTISIPEIRLHKINKENGDVEE